MNQSKYNIDQIVNEPIEKHKCTILYFHGLQWDSIDQMTEFDIQNDNCRIVTFLAPKKQSKYFSCDINSYYEIHSKDNFNILDVQRYWDNCRKVIRDETQLLSEYDQPSKRIIIIGYDIGSMMAQQMAMSWEDPCRLGGVICVSGTFARSTPLSNINSTLSLPILHLHGGNDEHQDCLTCLRDFKEKCYKRQKNFEIFIDTEANSQFGQDVFIERIKKMVNSIFYQFIIM